MAKREIRHGRHLSRGEIWTMVHRRKDGSYVHDDARAVGEAIAELESRDESTKELSQNDSLAQVLGKEHSGRIRGVGHGPCPTKLFGSASQQPSYGGQIEKYQREIEQLQVEAAEKNKKIQTMANLVRFLMQRQGDDLPPEIAFEMDALDSGVAVPETRHSTDNPNLLPPP
ncbi:hypothetical protein PIB30_030235 [Stylosanthes scabra]|uniref:Transposase n=1 Tax=Stylosanthes scabra TaxID=79078 RepID=A0ABU6W9V1_9FABA|nr:hypothetical protein [Stylosanthes scabra]